VDEAEHCVSVSTYLFNCFHPNGIEKKLSTIHYNKKSGFSLEEAKGFMNRICTVLNKTNWRRENDVYGKH
jgi:hypothetical protein